MDPKKEIQCVICDTIENLVECKGFTGLIPPKGWGGIPGLPGQRCQHCMESYLKSPISTDVPH